jgi:hypothetical protein
MENKKTEHILSRRLVPVERGKIQGKSAGGSEYSGHIVYSCMKMEK